jgi:branched-chain amino acid transport system permease protein
MRFAQGYYLMGYAALVMLLMVFCPTGLLGFADRLLTPKVKNGGAGTTAPQKVAG